MPRSGLSSPGEFLLSSRYLSKNIAAVVITVTSYGVNGKSKSSVGTLNCC